VCVPDSAPRLDEACEFVSATQRSLTFRWTAATSATSYRLVGHSKNDTSATNNITIDTLTPGLYYAFILIAVGSDSLESNGITCSNSTSK